MLETIATTKIRNTDIEAQVSVLTSQLEDAHAERQVAALAFEERQNVSGFLHFFQPAASLLLFSPPIRDPHD